MMAHEPPEARKRQSVPDVGKVDVGLSVSLPRRREYCVGPRFHAAVDEAREMNPEKWKRRIRHRIDQIPNESRPVRLELKILAPEGHDPGRPNLARKGANPITVQTRAGDDVIGGKVARLGCDSPPFAVRRKLLNPRPDMKWDSRCSGIRNHCLHDRVVIDYALLRNPQGGYPGCVGLVFPDSGPFQPFETTQTILLAALVEALEARHLCLVDSDHQFAADFMGDSFLAAELGHQADSVDGHAGLRRAGFVVKPRMQYAAVMRALVSTEARFLFQQEDFAA